MKLPARRILYIDDDAALCRLVQRDFRRHGYEVVCATSGEEGEARASEGFAAICVDHYMPGRDGLQTLARLRALPDMPPIVYVTGSEEGRVAIAALHAGAADYIIKDASPDFLALLRSTVDGAVERAGLLRERERTLEDLRIARDQAEQLAEQRMVLIQEVNHRVANSLQLIAALTQMQENAISDPAARAALAGMRSRVYAVAGVHRRLYTSDDIRHVALDDYIRGLLDEIRRSIQESDTGHAFELSLSPVLVPTDTAVSVGVVIAELVTNAVKYAYPAGKGGPIRILLAREGEDAVLVVEDDGVGSQGPAAKPGTGMGQRLIQSIASSIKGQVDRMPQETGTRVRFSFPLALSA